MRHVTVTASSLNWWLGTTTMYDVARRPNGNGGAPVSLHVVPRPSAVPIMEVDEERTTLDDAEARKAAAEWEDGTTVEESTLAQGKSFPHPQPAPPQNPFRAEGNTTNT